MESSTSCCWVVSFGRMVSPSNSSRFAPASVRSKNPGVKTTKASSGTAVFVVLRVILGTNLAMTPLVLIHPNGDLS